MLALKHQVACKEWRPKKVIKDAYSGSDSSERYKDMFFSVGNFEWLASGSFFGLIWHFAKNDPRAGTSHIGRAIWSQMTMYFL